MNRWLGRLAATGPAAERVHARARVGDVVRIYIYISLRRCTMYRCGGMYTCIDIAIEADAGSNTHTRTHARMHTASKPPPSHRLPGE